MKIRRSMLVLISCAAFSVTAPIQAASVSVTLDQPNKQQVLPAGVDYLQVTISDGIGGAIDFFVETLAAVEDLAGEPPEPFGIQKFSFNFGSSGARLGNVELPDGWNYGSYLEYPFGVFDATLETTYFNKSDTLSFSIAGVDGDRPVDYLQSLSLGDARLGNYQFLARVGGLELPKYYGECIAEDPECEPRTFNRGSKFAGGTSVVPIPAAAWLLGSALLGLAGIGRERISRRRTG